MKTTDTIMAKAHALLPAAHSADPDAYDKAMESLEADIQDLVDRCEGRHKLQRIDGTRISLAAFAGMPAGGVIIQHTQDDELVGLPAQAVLDGGMFTPALADDEPRRTPDVDQMLEDLAAAGVMMMGRDRV